VLRQVEQELVENIAKVCDTSDVLAESTGELERLGTTLSAAAHQARAAAALRRRMRSSDIVARLAERLSTPPEGEAEVADLKPPEASDEEGRSA
jgi:hypothetical protein